MIIVTGTGRSGTSILAKVLKRCGCNFRGGWSDEIRAGLEDPEVVLINEMMFREYNLDISRDFFSKDQIEELSKKYGSILKEISQRIKFVKDPRFCKTLEVWLKAGVSVEFLIVSLRDKKETILSAIDYGDSELSFKGWEDQISKRLANLFRLIFEYELDFQIVYFPNDYLTPFLSASFENISKKLNIDHNNLLNAIRNEFKIEKIKFSNITSPSYKPNKDRGFLLSPVNFMRRREYYENPRREFLEFISPEMECILDVGCAKGYLARSIKEINPRCKIFGIELNFDMAKIASLYMDKVILGDAEKIDLRDEGFEEKSFDCIIYGDILEHLRDPWSVIYQHKKFLKDDGIIIASIPNVRNSEVIRSLVEKGRWIYKEEGILDSDHIRFFTLKDIKHMFSLLGFEIMKIKENKLESKEIVDNEEFNTIQYIVVAKKIKNPSFICSIIIWSYNIRNK